MDVKKVFRGISSKLSSDFEISSEINHNGNKGAYRESALREFLLSGRLPKRFGIGSGEIIGPARNVSKQSDLIIYDQLDGVSLIYDENIQVYPVECVFGVIEVKSRLSKAELIMSLNNIKSVKSLAPEEVFTKNPNAWMTVTQERPRPFGIIFAYSLAGNSLESLRENLAEWEKENDQRYWPNLVVVLGEGILLHAGEGLRNMSLFSNDEILKAQYVSYLAYKKDTLLHFYSVLIDLCANTQLGPVNLKRYQNPAEKLGDYLLKNHDRFCSSVTDEVLSLKLDFIQTVVDYCRGNGRLTQRALLLKQMGLIPQGVDDDYLDAEIYLYNPDNIPGLDDELSPVQNLGDALSQTEHMTLLPSHTIEVNGEYFVIPWGYLKEECFEVVSGKSSSDL
jgi:hypothetical protein